MPLTDKLGVTDARFGNFQLGIGSNGTSGTVFNRSFSDSLTWVEDFLAYVTNLALSSNDELDPEFFLILSGDERGNDAKFVLSGSY